MSALDTALKVVKLLSAIVWLGVGLVTLWGSWKLFTDIGPALGTLGEALGPALQTGGGARLPALPEGVTLPPQFQQLLDQLPAAR